MIEIVVQCNVSRVDPLCAQLHKTEFHRYISMYPVPSPWGALVGLAFSKQSFKSLKLKH